MPEEAVLFADIEKFALALCLALRLPVLGWGGG